MLITEDNNNNSRSDLLEMKKKQVELEESKREDEMKAYEKMLENLGEKIEDLTDVLTDIKNLKPEEKAETPDFFDNDFNKNLISSIDKVFELLKKFKQPSIDLAPITSIATEIKNQNSALIKSLGELSKTDNSGYERLLQQTMAMIQRSNDFISKGITQVNYSEELKSLRDTIENNKVIGWESQSVRNQHGNLVITSKALFKK